MIFKNTQVMKRQKINTSMNTTGRTVLHSLSRQSSALLKELRVLEKLAGEGLQGQFFM